MGDDLGLTISNRDALADWIETSLLVRGTAQLGVDALTGMAEAEAKQGAAQTSHAIRTMEKRASLLGDAYPFQVVSNLAVRANSDAANSPYATLLLLSSGSVARQTVVRDSTSEMEMLFEKLTESALQNLWGLGSRALRFGFPSDHGRPQTFSAAVEWLAKEMGIAVGRGYRPERRKDGGVDVVAWRPFPDGRSGFPVVLAQCTLQSELFSKSGDVDVRIWSAWLALDFEPQTALAVPGLITSKAEWGQIALRSMILDRMRLAHLLGRASRQDTLTWTEQTLEPLRGLLLAGQR